MKENRFIDRPLKLRISTEMHQRLKKRAQKNSQTMAAQIRVYIADGLHREEDKINRGKAIQEEEAGGKKDAQ